MPRRLKNVKWGETMTAEVPAEVETPVAFVPKDLPADTIDNIRVPSFPPSCTMGSLHPRPRSMSASPTELGKEIEHSKEQTATHFAPFNLRDILSPLALLHAPTPEGRPQITITENAGDFWILLKMFY